MGTSWWVLEGQTAIKTNDIGTLAVGLPSRSGSICFHILHRLYRLLCGVNLRKPLDGVFPAFRSEISDPVGDFSYSSRLSFSLNAHL